MTNAEAENPGPRAAYERRLRERQAWVAAADRAHHRLAIPRIVAFGVALGIAWYAIAGELSPSWLGAPAAALLWLGRRMRDLERRRARATRGHAYYARALDRLDGSWGAPGHDGARFLDREHLYAGDLDLLGDGSLFARLSCARTAVGESTLAAWLLAPASARVVLGRQHAVAELSALQDLREDLAIVGEDAGEELHRDRLVAWCDGAFRLPGAGARAVVRGLSVLGAASLLALLASLAGALGMLELATSSVAALRPVSLLIALSLGIVTWRMRARTEPVLHAAEQAGRELRLVVELLARLEAEPFTAPSLQTLRARLATGGRTASDHIGRLGRLMDLVDARHGSFVRLFGIFVLWDVHLAYALEDWRAENGPHVEPWLATLGELEALVSLATYRHDNPDDPFPDLVDGPPRFQGEALGHPLLRPASVVRNDVRLGGAPQVLVVSGSNMSGKSTLLRTVGVNAVLAQAGAPVFANRLRLSPVALGASITTRDSLREGTSRFYAEITRLRGIVGRCDGPLPVLFLIDELLQGTNSHDRRAGAEGIVRGLVERHAIGLLTTHDLALTAIADDLGDAAANIHFADELRGGRLRFDYRIRDGVVRRSNALELMRSIGLDV